MSLEFPTTPTAARASAVSRLDDARDELTLAKRLRTAVAGTRLERYGAAVVGSAGARVAVRQEWLHWVDKGQSMHPEADGDWGLRPNGASATAAEPGALPPSIYRCSCGHLLRTLGNGRHRLFFELGDTVLDDVVTDQVCPGCAERLPGKNRSRPRR
jgi:hypothetical protein